MKLKIQDKALYLPVIILVVYFIIRLADQSKILSIFPLDLYNDISSYLGQLFFLKECGLFQHCPYWYNGMTTFTLIPPGWFLFTLPLYILTDNVLISAFSSFLIMLVLGFVIFYFGGKSLNYSFWKRLAFFIFFFGNAVAIGNFLRLGRYHEMFGWLWFLVIAFVCLNYLKKQVDRKFLWIILPYSLTIISHPSVAVFASLVLFSLFLAKSWKEKIKISLTIIGGILLTAFWTTKYLKSFYESSGPLRQQIGQTLEFSLVTMGQQLITFLIPLIFLILIYFYFKQASRKQKLFFVPFIILAIVLFFRLNAFIPIMQGIHLDSYNYLFIFFSIFVLFELNLEVLKLKKIVGWALILAAVVSAVVSAVYTPYFIEHTELDTELLSVMDSIDGKYFMMGRYPGYFPNAFASYGAIYLNISTPNGWHLAPERELFFDLRKTTDHFLSRQCEGFLESNAKINNEYFVSFDKNCDFFKSCGLNKVEEKGRACLYKVDSI